MIDKIWEEGRKRPAGDWCTLEAWARRAPPVTPTTLPVIPTATNGSYGGARAGPPVNGVLPKDT